MKHCDTCGKELPADTSTSVYCCTAGTGCSTVTAICSLCEFEHGWGYPFCRRCGKIFDPVPLLERVKAYVSSVNSDYAEDEERDQTVAIIEALIKHAQQP